jgi:hypothetical protein
MISTRRAVLFMLPRISIVLLRSKIFAAFKVRVIDTARLC